MSLCLISGDPRDELEIKHILLISLQLKKKGYRFSILTDSRSALFSRAKLQGLPVIGHPLDGRSGWLATWRLQRLFKKNGVQLVHYFDRAAALSASRAAKKAGIRVQLATWKPEWSLKEALPLLSHMDAVVCRTEENKKTLLRNNLAAGKAEVIPTGIDLTLFQNPQKNFLRQELHLSADSFLVGLLCPLEDLKTFKSHLEAIRILDREAPGVKVIVLGSGPLNLERLRQEQALELENLYFYLGFNEKLSEVISAFEAFVFGSYALPEEYILKAMAWKVPVIGVMAAGITGLIIQRETGFLVPPGDPEALARTVLKLYLDRSLARSLADRAYELVSNKHSCEAMAAKMVDHYEFLTLQKGVKIG